MARILNGSHSLVMLATASMVFHSARLLYVSVVLKMAPVLAHSYMQCSDILLFVSLVLVLSTLPLL